MIKNIQAIRGMNDALPNQTAIWQYIEKILKKILDSYGYKEIRFPILEQTLLFKRTIGELTDILDKEMYTFIDRNGDSLTLRPEGTASCVRLGIEHNLLYNQEQRLWYIGPMFRHERPQKGRYRQFTQIGVEVFGLQGPDIDAELIMLAARWWKALDITEHVSLELNSIGSLKSRTNYCNALITFLEKNKEKLDEDCRDRISSNPLRILDSKNPNVKALLNRAPALIDYLDDDSFEHFNSLQKLLRKLGIRCTFNQHLIRGLDYYNRTVFEWVTTNLGTQNTICAGGRYDGLVKQLSGYMVPAVGLAIGLERLILLLQSVHPQFKIESSIDVYLVSSGENTQPVAMCLAEHIRDVLPNIKLMTNYGGGSFKKQFIRANKYGASIVLVLGELEIATGEIVIKDLRFGKQIRIKQENVVEHLRTLTFKVGRNM